MCHFLMNFSDYICKHAESKKCLQFSGKNGIFISINLASLQWVPVTKAWHALRLQMEETAL